MSTMIPKLHDQLTRHEVELRTIADWLDRYAAGQNVDDPLPCAYRDVCAALRCLREAAVNLGRVK